MFGKKKKGRVKLDMSFEDAIDKALNTPISKLPVFEQNKPQIEMIEKVFANNAPQGHINIIQEMLREFAHEINEHKGELHAEFKNGSVIWELKNLPQWLEDKIHNKIDAIDEK